MGFIYFKEFYLLRIARGGSVGTVEHPKEGIPACMLVLIEVNSYLFSPSKSCCIIRAKKYFLKPKDFGGSRENIVRDLEA